MAVFVTTNAVVSNTTRLVCTGNVGTRFTASNIAVTARSPCMTNSAGFEVPFRLPLQPVNCHPSLADAVSVTTAPSAYSNWSGERSTVPSPLTTTSKSHGGSKCVERTTAPPSPTATQVSPLNAMSYNVGMSPVSAWPQLVPSRETTMKPLFMPVPVPPTPTNRPWP